MFASGNPKTCIMPTPITIRAATGSDRARLAGMLREFNSYLQAIAPGDSMEGRIEELVDLSLGARPVCSCLIAERDGDACGYVAFHPGVWEIYKAVHVVSLFVKPDARRCGVGQQLMEEVRAEARENGAERIVWFVWKRNPAATAFYEKLGAKIFDDNHLMAWAVDGRAVD